MEQDELLPNEPRLMPMQGTFFNGDFNVANEFLKLKEKYSIATILETGTCVGGSTKWFAENFEKVSTVEIMEQYRNIALERCKGLKNITSYLGNSVANLTVMLSPCDNKTILFLDSHWNQHFPLIEELQIIKNSGLKPCIVVHDCFVPNEPSLGFDQYNGVTISFETMKPYFDDIYGVGGY